MPEIVGVKFKEAGKMYYFDPNGLTVQKGQKVIVENAQGIQCGTCCLSNSQISDDFKYELKKVIRVATEKDLLRLEENEAKQKKAAKIFEEKVAAHNLEMKLVNVEYTFDNSKIIFYFTADGRIDFRELVKDMATVFRTRIELRQVGVRDEAKILGGLGICGREFCCAGFLNDFQPVSIKMAKEQNLSLNPVKISGTCGRLMCCLKYEQDTYEYLNKITPRVGSTVKTPHGKGTVEEANVITGKMKVRLDKNSDALPEEFDRSELRILRESKAPQNDENDDLIDGNLQ